MSVEVSVSESLPSASSAESADPRRCSSLRLSPLAHSTAGCAAPCSCRKYDSSGAPAARAARLGSRPPPPGPLPCLRFRWRAKMPVSAGAFNGCSAGVWFGASHGDSPSAPFCCLSLRCVALLGPTAWGSARVLVSAPASEGPCRAAVRAAPAVPAAPQGLPARRARPLGVPLPLSLPRWRRCCSIMAGSLSGASRPALSPDSAGVRGTVGSARNRWADSGSQTGCSEAVTGSS